MIAEGVFAGSCECGWVVSLLEAFHSDNPERASEFVHHVALDVTEDGAWKLTVQDDAPWWVFNDLRLMGVPL